jgi:hypothetical protein
MTTNNAQTEQEFIASQKAKTSSKGFTPTKKPKPSTANAAAHTAPPTAAAAAPDDTTDTLQNTIATAIGSMSEYSAHSTEALATQREVIADRVADQMAALLDPDLFLQDVMARTVAKLNQRTVEIPNFFDIAFDLPPTPKVRHLPATPEAAP